MWPLIEVAVEAKSKADDKKLMAALIEFAAADPAFAFHIDPGSGRAIMGGTDEGHLVDKADLLRHDHKIGVSFGAPQVAYREGLGKRAEIDHSYKAQEGDSGRFARVRIVFEPGEPGSGFRFESAVANSSVPAAFVTGVERGLESARREGLVAGYPVIDLKVTLVDGAYHDLDSSVAAFEIAARAAFSELRDKAAPKLLMPIMKVEVTTPEDYVGDVIGDLNSRRGMIQGTDQRGSNQIIIATVPLGNMFGYVNVLRSMTQGRADFHMQYDHYERVPQAPAPEPPDDLYPPAIGMRA